MRDLPGCAKIMSLPFATCRKSDDADRKENMADHMGDYRYQRQLNH